MNNGCGMWVLHTFRRGSVPSSQEQAIGHPFRQHWASLMNTSIVEAAPATQRGKCQADCFLLLFFKKSHHMIPALRHQISCCYKEQDWILFSSRLGKITNMANRGSCKETGLGLHPALGMTVASDIDSDPTLFVKQKRKKTKSQCQLHS